MAGKRRTKVVKKIKTKTFPSWHMGKGPELRKKNKSKRKEKGRGNVADKKEGNKAVKEVIQR
jgi:hypothetical protein